MIPSIPGLKVQWSSPLADVEAEYAHAGHPVWQGIAPTDDRGGFRMAEFEQPEKMDAHFLRWLWWVRQVADVPMRITDDARGQEEEIGADKSTHKKRPCRAVDLWVHNRYERARITVAAILLGCRRWGTYPERDRDNHQHGPGPLHLDAEHHTDNPSPRNWTSW